MVKAKSQCSNEILLIGEASFITKYEYAFPGAVQRKWSLVKLAICKGLLFFKEIPKRFFAEWNHILHYDEVPAGELKETFPNVFEPAK